MNLMCHPREFASMHSIATDTNSLTWDVLTMKRPGLSRDVPPGKEDLMWVANSSTLISGARDAILVDTFLTIAQSQALADWVEASDKNLVAIYITHGHGDHFFGLAPMLKRFPRARPVAIPSVVKAMQAAVAPESVDRWRKLFPSQIADRLIAAEPITNGILTLERHELIPIDAGRTDTAPSTCLHVPSIGLIVAGDAVYNGIHPYLGETTADSRLEWIATLDRLEALSPSAVIAGHKIPENDDDPRIIGETRQYIRDFNRLDRSTTTPRQLYDAMLQLYPDRANPGSLWRAANAAK